MGSNDVQNEDTLGPVIDQTVQLWQDSGLTYDLIRYVTREARNRMRIERPARPSSAARPPLRPEELLRLLEKAAEIGGDRGLLVQVLFESGARVSEFVALTTPDFDPQRSTLRIGPREIPLRPETAHALKTSLEAHPRTSLFASNRGRPYTPRRIQQIVRECAAQAGITRRVHPHVFRQTMAALLLEQGTDLPIVREFLGHKRMQTTRLYVRPIPEIRPARVS